MIYSEIGKLKQVLLHKPDYALGYLTPQNCRHYLFDDVLWIEKARQEHDLFEKQLRSAGVEVLLLHRLMQETLADPQARAWLIEARLRVLGFPPLLFAELNQLMQAMPLDLLTQRLLGGWLRQDCPVLTGHLQAFLWDTHDFVLPPLPNQLYVRDSSSWIGAGLMLASMKFSVRRGEVLNLAAIYQFHPRFKSSARPIWFDGAQSSRLPAIEGGDVLVLNPQTVLLGISQRTTPEAVELLAQALLTAGAFKQVFAIRLPDARRFMHLDVVLTMVREDTFVSAFPRDNPLPTWRLRLGQEANLVVVEQVDDFPKALAHALNVPRIHFIRLQGDYFAVQREQWSDAANLLAIAPGEVLAYDRNQTMNHQLKAAGLRVHELESAELSRGRGGARCMSCPLLREAY